jgi:hypothetical protein
MISAYNKTKNHKIFACYKSSKFGITDEVLNRAKEDIEADGRKFKDVRFVNCEDGFVECWVIPAN